MFFGQRDDAHESKVNRHHKLIEIFTVSCAALEILLCRRRPLLIHCGGGCGCQYVGIKGLVVVVMELLLLLCDLAMGVGGV